MASQCQAQTVRTRTTEKKKRHCVKFESNCFPEVPFQASPQHPPLPTHFHRSVFSQSQIGAGKRTCEGCTRWLYLHDVFENVSKRRAKLMTINVGKGVCTGSIGNRRLCFVFVLVPVRTRLFHWLGRKVAQFKCFLNKWCLIVTRAWSRVAGHTVGKDFTSWVELYILFISILPLSRLRRRFTVPCNVDVHGISEVPMA